MFDAAPPPKVWIPARPAIIRAASLKDAEKGTFPFPFAVPAAWATWNPNDKSPGVVLSNQNLTATMTAAGSEAVRSTVGMSSGKWYWEQAFSGTSSIVCLVGVGKASVALSTGGPGQDANS